MENQACSKTRLVLKQALGKSGLQTAFSYKSKVAVPKLKFWNSLNHNRIEWKKMSTPPYGSALWGGGVWAGAFVPGYSLFTLSL
jgi:hypothetical protein